MKKKRGSEREKFEMESKEKGRGSVGQVNTNTKIRISEGNLKEKWRAGEGFTLIIYSDYNLCIIK